MSSFICAEIKNIFPEILQMHSLKKSLSLFKLSRTISNDIGNQDHSTKLFCPDQQHKHNTDTKTTKNDEMK